MITIDFITNMVIGVAAVALTLMVVLVVQIYRSDKSDNA
jgi:multisubunit Na+/H+ antiporter MnhC subunit